MGVASYRVLLFSVMQRIEPDKNSWHAIELQQGGLALLQEAILTEVEKKHSSEQEVRFNKAYLTKWFSFCFIVWSCRNLIGLNRS